MTNVGSLSSSSAGGFSGGLSGNLSGSLSGELATGVASLDPPLLQQTKSEIRNLTAEIARLANSPISIAEFCNGFLPRLITAMGAEGAAIWQTASSELQRDWSTLPVDDQIDPASLLLVAQHHLPSQLIGNTPSNSIEAGTVQNKLLHPSDSHKRILDCVIAEGAPILVPPLTVSIEAQRPSNPLEHAIIVIPVRIEEEIEFVLEVVQHASGGPAAQRGYLRFVAQMADLMSDFLRRHALREQTKRSHRVQQFEYWLGTVSQARDNASQLRSVADALADLFSSFQVFLVRSGGRPRVLAASGLDTFDVRSETILALIDAERALATGALAAGGSSPIATPPAAVTEFESNQPPEAQPRGLPLLHKLLVSDRLVRLELDGHENFCAWLAFTDAVPKLSATGGATPSELRRVGASLAGLLDPIVVYASRFQSWWPFRTPPRWAKEATRSRMQVWTMRAALAGLLTIIALFPVPQQISTTAVLAPLKKRNYYAPFDATVKNVVVSDEQVVAPGDLLLELESTTLRREFERLGRELVAHQTRLQQLNFEQHSQTPSSIRLAQINEEIEIAKIKIEENQSLQKRLQTEIDKLTITADADGKLSTWDIRNRLNQRPVKSGDMLLSTYQPDGAWELQLSIPEHRVGLVQQTLSDSANRGLRVRYTLVSHPEHQLEGWLERLAEQATRTSDGKNVVLGTALVGDDLPLRKEGAIAQVVLECGRVPAIWLITRDAYWACYTRLKMLL